MAGRWVGVESNLKPALPSKGIDVEEGEGSL
jgi:hypothetical protein